MAKNKVDFKQLMLEKGERIGLYGAACLMVVLLVTGAFSAFMRESPAATVDEITKNAGTIETNLASGPPVSDPRVDPKELVPLDKSRLNPIDYLFPTDLSIDEGGPGKKRVNPTPLEVADGDFQIDAVRAQVRSYVLAMQGNNVRIGILKVREKAPDKKDKADPKDLNNRFGRTLRYNPFQRYEVPGFMMQSQALIDNGATPDKYILEFVDLKDKAVDNAKLAETVNPQRMVIISAAYPFAQLMERYRSALNSQTTPLKTLKDLITQKELMPQFEPCKVRRRELSSTGKPGQWIDLEIERTIAPVRQTSVGDADDDATLKNVVFPKSPLVIPLPKLARGDYPVLNLPNLSKAAAEVKKKLDNGAAPPLTPLEKKLQGDGLSVYERIDPKDRGGEEGPRDSKASDELVIADYCLIRLVDADPKLRPGVTYQYQIKVRLANPNYGAKDKVAFENLALTKEIESDWSPADPAKGQVTISREMFYYPTEMERRIVDWRARGDSRWNDKDAAYMEMHHWLETVRLDPNNPSSKNPLGEWAIASTPVRRGEYISRTENVKMAMWYITRETWDLAVPVRTGRPTLASRQAPGIPVNFVTEDLLVDWEGGRVDQQIRILDKTPKTISEDAALEILVMSPDGTLRVQNSHIELLNKERQARVNEVNKMLTEVEQKSKLGKDDPFKK
jgi:hypothetical protein